jgi:hypothetical protein
MVVMSDVTHILSQIESGDPAAAEELLAVDEALDRLAEVDLCRSAELTRGCSAKVTRYLERRRIGFLVSSSPFKIAGEVNSVTTGRRGNW